MSVVGSISIKNVSSISPASGPGECFQIHDHEGDNWTLCASSSDEKKEWVCAVLYVLGKPCTPTSSDLQMIETQQVEKPL